MVRVCVRVRVWPSLQTELSNKLEASVCSGLPASAPTVHTETSGRGSWLSHRSTALAGRGASGRCKGSIGQEGTGGVLWNRLSQ